MNRDKIFIKITNKEIYDKLEAIETKLNYVCNKTKLSFWIATTSLSISLLIIGALVSLRN